MAEDGGGDQAGPADIPGPNLFLNPLPAINPVAFNNHARRLMGEVVAAADAMSHDLPCHCRLEDIGRRVPHGSVLMPVCLRVNRALELAGIALLCTNVVPLRLESTRRMAWELHLTRAYPQRQLANVNDSVAYLVDSAVSGGRVNMRAGGAEVLLSGEYVILRQRPAPMIYPHRIRVPTPQGWVYCEAQHNISGLSVRMNRMICTFCLHK